MQRPDRTPKSGPVQSPLAESTKQLRIPQIRSPPNKRFAHLPELSTKFRIKTSEDSPFKDKKRLVDQFYELATPGMVTPKRTVTPTISRSNTVEDLSIGSKFNFLKATPAYVDDNSVIRSTVNQTEKKVLQTVKHRNEESELEMSKTRVHFESMQSDITQMRNKLRLYISLLEDKSKSVEEGYERLEGEIAKLYKTLSTLDQYEIVVESSRAKMLESKKNLHQLTSIVERAEVMNVEHREKLKVTKKWVIMFLCGLILMCLIKCTFV